MIAKRLIFIFVVLVFGNRAQAQEIADYHINISVAKSFEPGVIQAELGLNKDLFNFFHDRLQLGFGIRVGIQDNVDPILTSAFKDYKSESATIDTLTFNRVQSLSFNFNAQAQYYFKRKFALGCNVDIIGISKGAETRGIYLPGESAQAAGYKSQSGVLAKPTEANAFSFTDQKGSLNSQLYLRFDANKKISLKAGLSFLMTEYTTKNTFGNKQQYRFENNLAAYFVGISFNKFEKNDI